MGAGIQICVREWRENAGGGVMCARRDNGKFVSTGERGRGTNFVWEERGIEGQIWVEGTGKFGVMGDRVRGANLRKGRGEERNSFFV